MVAIKGTLKTVTASPSTAVEVWITAEEVRTRAGGTVVLPEKSRVLVGDNGDFTTNIEPGAALLIVAHNGYRGETIPLLVTDSHTTVDQCINAARLADGTEQTELEQLIDRISKSQRFLSDGIADAKQAARDAHASATAADKSKTAAATNAAQAKASATAADQSKTAAANSAAKAKGSEDAADKSKTEAADSAAKAKGSATAADKSKTEAADSAAKAKGSEDAAAASEGKAAASATAADKAKTDAVSAADGVRADADRAQTSATAADQSKTAAADSAAKAEFSEYAAANSAAKAKGSEDATANSAAKAKGSEDAAANSAAKAKGSEDAAANSAADAKKYAENTKVSAGEKAPLKHTHKAADITDLDEKLSTKADKSHTHDSRDINDPTSYIGNKDEAGRVVAIANDGFVHSDSDPTAGTHLVRKRYVDGKVNTKADKSHTHDSRDINDTTGHLGHTDKAGCVVAIANDGFVHSDEDPTAGTHIVRKSYVDTQVNTKADEYHNHTTDEITDLYSRTVSEIGMQNSAGKFVRANRDGWVCSYEFPTNGDHLANKEYVDRTVNTKADESHKHDSKDINDRTSYIGIKDFSGRVVAVGGDGFIHSYYMPTASTQLVPKSYVDMKYNELAAKIEKLEKK